MRGKECQRDGVERLPRSRAPAKANHAKQENRRGRLKTRAAHAGGRHDVRWINPGSATRSIRDEGRAEGGGRRGIWSSVKRDRARQPIAERGIGLLDVTRHPLVGWHFAGRQQTPGGRDDDEHQGQHADRRQRGRRSADCTSQPKRADEDKRRRKRCAHERPKRDEAPPAPPHTFEQIVNKLLVHHANYAARIDTALSAARNANEARSAYTQRC